MMKISARFTHNIVAFIILVCFFNVSIIAQNKPVKQKSEFWSKVRFGGGIGLGFGNNTFSGTLAPSAIYEINRTVSVGTALSGSYYSHKDFLKSTILGGSIIGLFHPIQQIQLSTEFEENYVIRNYDNPIYIDDSYWQPSLFLGAGYRTQNVTIGLRYDVLYNNRKSIYADAWMPFVRVYF